MRWDFNGAWEGVVTRGPRKGTRMMCKVASMTAEKWAIVSKKRGYTVAFEKASFVGKKSATFAPSPGSFVCCRDTWLRKELERPQLWMGLFYLRPQWGIGSCGRGRQGTGAAVFRSIDITQVCALRKRER